VPDEKSSSEKISENNPYFVDDRQAIRNFLLVKPNIYENEFVEDFIVNLKKERFLLKVVFVGGLLLLYAVV
jgi:hypothetical protein